MNAPHPPPSASADAPAAAVCFAAAGVDAVVASGAALAAHAARGGRAVLVCLTGPEDPRLVEAARALGVESVRFAGFLPGSLASQETLVARLRTLLAELEPGIVAGPSPDSAEHGQRALGCALLAATARGPERELWLFGAAQAGAGEIAADGAALARKRRAFEGLGLTAPAAAVERCVRLSSRAAADAPRAPIPAGTPRATAVVSTWNKKEDLRSNLETLRAQTLPFREIVVVDNKSRDGTAAMVAAEFPGVRLIVMPHDRFGACTTFNLGFAAVTTELTAILDDDIVMPPDWLEKATRRLQAEPATTAIVSTQVIEPGMPAAYLAAPEFRQERYMSTFRGCASLARSEAIARAGYYDERLFIYGNERDLTCRLLNLGYRVLQYPGCHVFHKTPFGIKMGKRSLYYHARNAWLSMLKYAPAKDLVRLPFLVVSKVLLRGESQEAAGRVQDATGTIGIGRSVRETPGAWWVLVKAGLSVLANVPYCLKHRAPCRAPDFELPLD